ncbi:MAG: hypothetical protein ACLR5T_03000 [Veillonella sp.]
MSHINDTLKRINELAAKKKLVRINTRGISRKKNYTKSTCFIRSQITSTLDRVEFIDPVGKNRS